MAGANVKARIAVADASAVTMARGFQGYALETEQPVRTPHVESNPAIEAMKTAWKACISGAPHAAEYVKIFETVKMLTYSAKDVEHFSLALVEFQSETSFSNTAGLFLSALINNGKDADYVIHTNHLTDSINNIGYENTKNVTINGDAGDILGQAMTAGTITVKGGADRLVGRWMEQGAIIVEGDVEDGVGHMMNGGAITVHGNAHGGVGNSMKGGIITVEGDIDGCVGNLMELGTIIVGEDVQYDVGRSMKSGAIIVNGDVYGGTGEEMKGGAITVKGDADASVGRSMEGGAITVGKDARGQVGESMKGGLITVNRNASDDVGTRMERGEIHLNGGLNYLGMDFDGDHIGGGMRGGKIFHDGELIAGK